MVERVIITGFPGVAGFVFDIGCWRLLYSHAWYSRNRWSQLLDKIQLIQLTHIHYVRPLPKVVKLPLRFARMSVNYWEQLVAFEEQRATYRGTNVLTWVSAKTPWSSSPLCVDLMGLLAGFWCCYFLLMACAPLTRGWSEKEIHFRRVCVFKNWLHWYQYPRQHDVEDINATLCTHIVYYGVALKDNLVITADPYNVGQIKKIVDLHRSHKMLKVVVCLGGPNFPWRYLSTMMTTPANRSQFVASVVSYLSTRHFDGLHLDFPFPEDTPRADRNGFAWLILDLRRGFQRESNRTGKPQFELSATVSCRKTVIEKSYEITNIAQNLDWISLRAFDFDEDNEGRTAHHAPLRERKRKEDKPQEQNIEWAVKHWTETGVDRSRLVLGISFDAAAYELRDSRVFGFWVPQTGPLPRGNYTHRRGRLSYYEVCEYLNQGAPRMWSSMAKVPFAIYDGWLWIGYDDPRSLSIKLSWMRQSYLGGWMAWHLANDDFHGTFCGQGKYPLLTTLNGYKVPGYDFEGQTSGGNTMRSLRYPRLLATVLSTIATLVFARMS